MNRHYPCLIALSLLFLLLFCQNVFAATLKGLVKDVKTGEPLVGASVMVKNTKMGSSAGLDGTFQIKDIPAGVYQLQVSYITYQTATLNVNVDKEDVAVVISLEENTGKTLNEVLVTGVADRSTENSARLIERNANQLMNIVSGKTIEISPDLTIANLIQRVSGVSIERNSNGDGQYAILRGMDKRYNYTLVNGIKIPSPDNKYRYVPLDIFPSELLGRLEVTKTLTPDLEGDAVGGVVNMVMKDAPNQLEIRANVAGGYNELFMERGFGSFDRSQIQHQSPYELKGSSYSATVNDFPKATASTQTKTPIPNIIGGFSVGNRFLQNRLGVILAASYQNTYRGSNSRFFSSTVYDTEKTSRITSLAERKFSDQQQRLGLHAKADFRFNQRNKLQWYNAFLNLANIQLRDTKTTEFSSGGYDPLKGNAGLSFSTRSRVTRQQILNSTLQGNHLLSNKLKVNWSVVYSLATSRIPDNTTVSVLGKRENFVETKTYASQSTRRWEHNSDQDYAGYLNASYRTLLKGNSLEIDAGGLYRDKRRENFYNNYQLQPANTFTQYGKDFFSNADINWTLNNPRGSVASALTYKATEQIGAAYAMAKLETKKWQVIGGLRTEHTNQGYEMLFPLGELRPSGTQTYTDLLPSLNLKYGLTSVQSLRASYFRSLNRPGFFEIVPGKVVNEEFQERGNPDLKRALADNFDIRYEVFPTPSDLFMVGVFYKYIKDPIEYALSVDATRGQDVFYSPGNYGNATNYGLELDLIKYFHKVGIKANYTYTNSSITTQKIIRERDANGNLFNKNVLQTRPLYGQAAHVANVTLLYKDTKSGWDAQVAASYTGERINTVSQFLDNDLWQEAFIQMDASVEKSLRGKWVIFAKANNLLDTPLRVIIKNTNPVNNDLEADTNTGNSTLIRQDFYKRSFVAGLRFKL
ncbi:TonB-dependent receptor [Runella sp. MFBS21]|uniref:TonB-dependent receptor n=1 Tax=Runella sp. MFBS21 TaxID=3034018 RepID=UPI0023F85B9E|nr:TonB-dependent receptor [Runella sp. MFBS21]MDF7821393.1 TonB-dependent receptor [Runella sp. MFBS21]